MGLKEIGSEFWDATTKKSEKKFLLSGRTALEYIIRDIKADHHVESVLLPSWCCHTMIEPFIRHGISIRFYDVFLNSQNGLCVEVPEPVNNEMFYHMSYFGFEHLKGMEYQYIRQKWDYIIADETHSWLGNKQYEMADILPDYKYVSYRKWTGVYGIASAIKTTERFQVDFSAKKAKEYLELRKEASALKASYMSGSDIEKADFLNRYNQAEELLEEEYVDYVPSIEVVEQLINIDKRHMVEKRRQNANYLIQRLSQIEEIKLVFDCVNEGDVPLFVPILVDEAERDELRRFLIKKDIYCPVHWPLSEYHEEISGRAVEIYNRELSLLCDQRYDLEDMKRMVEAIESFYIGRKK